MDEEQRRLRDIRKTQALETISSALRWMNIWLFAIFILVSIHILK